MSGVTKKVNRAKMPIPADAAPGRVAQRNRTRKAIVDAAVQLLAEGRTLSMADVMQAAQVSRRTIYMYFPTFEQLLLDATLGALSARIVDPVIAATKAGDVAGSVEQLSRTVNGHAAKTMELGRSLIRLTVGAREPHTATPRRGYRRVAWIERALEASQESFTRPQYEQLVSALTVLMGWEPLMILQDVRGLKQKDAEDVLAFAARAVVDAALKARTKR